MTARKKPKQWKAWGVFHKEKGSLHEIWMTRPDAAWDVCDRDRLNRIGEYEIRSVIITLAPTKRKRK